MTMTLKQVLKEMNTVTATSTDAENWQVVDWCSALSAYIAAMGEPVAWQARRHKRFSDEWEEWRYCSEQAAESIPTESTLDKWEIRALYSAPPASGDWDKVREVVIDLRRDSALLARDLTSENDLLDMADKLTAALPESQP